MDQSYKYWAFISYSHRDEDWGKWLHRELESYKVPRKLVGRPSRAGDLPARLAPVFRDREELPSDADLSRTIQRALAESRYLLVICSPHAAHSQYVNLEIKVFKSLGREDRILPLIVAGEPNVSAGPEAAEHECFPNALRYRIGPDGELTDDPASPIAADARKGRDSRENAKLKLLAGVLNVGLDELKQREHRRRIRRAVVRTSVSLLAIAIAVLLYTIAADGGLNLPAGAKLRLWLDRHSLSILRPVASDATVRAAAQRQRRKLRDVIKSAQAPDDLMFDSLKFRKIRSVWVTSQALTGVFNSPDLASQEGRVFLRNLDAPFRGDWYLEKDGARYAWPPANGEMNPAMPVLWTAAALASAIKSPGLLTKTEREIAERRFIEVQKAARAYLPTEDGGWNTFPNQIDPTEHQVYPTCLALLVLLEARAAGLPWEGTAERRDALLQATAKWLIDQYDEQAQPPGWHDASASTHETFDGLTLMAFSLLLRAESEAQVKLPTNILNRIPGHLIECVTRDLNFPIGSAWYGTRVKGVNNREYEAKQSIGFLWHGWAIDCAVRWLKRSENHPAPSEEIVRVRRSLGHLVVTLGDPAVSKASAEWIYIAAEMLYGLNAVPDS